MTHFNGGYNEILLGFLLLCQLIDFYSTWRVIRSGVGVEANPVVHWLMDRMGVNAALAVAKLAVSAIAVYLYLTDATGWLVATSLMYAAVALNNWKVMHHG